MLFLLAKGRVFNFFKVSQCCDLSLGVLNQPVTRLYSCGAWGFQWTHQVGVGFGCFMMVLNGCLVRILVWRLPEPKYKPGICN